MMPVWVKRGRILWTAFDSLPDPGSKPRTQWHWGILLAYHPGINIYFFAMVHSPAEDGHPRAPRNQWDAQLLITKDEFGFLTKPVSYIDCYTLAKRDGRELWLENLGDEFDDKDIGFEWTRRIIDTCLERGELSKRERLLLQADFIYPEEWNETFQKYINSNDS